MRMRSVLVGVTLLTTLAVAGQVSAQTTASNSGVQAGAAKVDITPASNELPPSYEGVHDRIYSRAIVVGNGTVIDRGSIVVRGGKIESVTAGAPRGLSVRAAARSPRRNALPLPPGAA